MSMIDRDVANRIRKIMDLEAELRELRATIPPDLRVLLALTVHPDSDGEACSDDQLECEK